MEKTSRREFIAAAAAGLGGLAVLGGAETGRPPQALPRRALGRTGVEVTVLGLGTGPMGHRNGNNPDLPTLVEAFGEAIDRGITYVDTARNYGPSEVALGEVLRTRRDKVFLAAKVMADTFDEARARFAETMGRLRVERLDLLHLHSVGERDVDAVLRPKDGAWAFLRKLKEEGRTRFLGLTAHSRPEKVARMIRETGDVDAIMVALNFVDRHVYGFEEKVLPLAREKGIGVMAMKVFGGVRASGLAGFANYGAPTPQPAQMPAGLQLDAMRYILSLEGVAGMVIGPGSAAEVRENIERIRAARPLAPADLAALVEKGKALAPAWGPRWGPA